MSDVATFWDARYASDDYAYGVQPNPFLAENIERLPVGRVLSLCEGEGRNGVFLAEQGFEVTGVDASREGLAKAGRLARKRGVGIHTECADLSDWHIEPGAWDAVISIFCHVPANVRGRIHREVVAGLRPGGAYLMEAYAPAQLGRGTGGPPDRSLMVALADARRELAPLRLEIAHEIERDLSEGRLHTGTGVVTEVLAFREG